MKTTQIALDDGLLKEIDQFIENRFDNRAEFISKACSFFLRYLHEQQLEQAYKKGYEQMPENLELAQASVLLVGEIMKKEDWE